MSVALSWLRLGARRPAISRVKHVGLQLEVAVLGRGTGAVVAAIRLPRNQAQKLAEAVMEAVERIEALKP